MAETLSRVTMETGGAADRDRLQGRGDETAAEDDPMLLIKAVKQEVDQAQMFQRTDFTTETTVSAFYYIIKRSIVDH